MDYLMRNDIDLPQEEWQSIDATVVQAAKAVLIARKFLPVYGPLGAGTQSVYLDTFNELSDSQSDFFGEAEAEPLQVKTRKSVEIPMLYKDFSIGWRDMEYAKQVGLPLDLSLVAAAANACARKEDQLIFIGNEASQTVGLATAEGTQKFAISDWKTGENAFQDIVKGLQSLAAKGFAGKFTLAVSPDLFTQLQRLQENTGLLESERIKKVLGGNLFMTPALGTGKAILVCAEPQNIDLVIGQDMITGYLGSEKLNHLFRVLETILLRIKRPESIVVFS